LKRQAKTGKVVRKIFDNLMILDLNDEGIGRELYFKGVHEKNSTRFYVNEIKPGMRILEIGANIGYYALIGAKAVGDAGRVYAFEPSPDNFNLLQKNVMLNSLEDRFELYPYGVGAREDELTFYVMNQQFHQA